MSLEEFMQIYKKTGLKEEKQRMGIWNNKKIIHHQILQY